MDKPAELVSKYCVLTLHNGANKVLARSESRLPTTACPPSYNNQAPWCNSPRKHFDLSMPMFLNIAEYKAGIVPVLYRRVRCRRNGGIKFVFKGNEGWLLVLLYNVGGSGQVVDVKIKGSNTDWIKMERNWGVNWQVSGDTVQKLHGQSLFFKVTSKDGQMVQSERRTTGLAIRKDI